MKPASIFIGKLKPPKNSGKLTLIMILRIEKILETTILKTVYYMWIRLTYIKNETKQTWTIHDNFSKKRQNSLSTEVSSK